MCSFLTVGIDSKRATAFEAALRGVRLDRDHGHVVRLEVDRAVNPGVARLFPSTDVLFLVTRGGCSCELNIARDRAANQAASDARLMKKEAKLRSKGYSETKVARMLEQPKQGGAPGVASALELVMKEYAPTRAYSHQVRADPLTEPVPATAQVVSF